MSNMKRWLQDKNNIIQGILDHGKTTYEVWLSDWWRTQVKHLRSINAEDEIILNHYLYVEIVTGIELTWFKYSLLNYYFLNRLMKQLIDVTCLVIFSKI